MKNEENTNNNNFQEQKMLGKVAIHWKCRKTMVSFLGIVNVQMPQP